MSSIMPSQLRVIDVVNWGYSEWMPLNWCTLKTGQLRSTELTRINIISWGWLWWTLTTVNGQCLVCLLYPHNWFGTLCDLWCIVQSWAPGQTKMGLWQDENFRRWHHFDLFCTKFENFRHILEFRHTLTFRQDHLWHRDLCQSSDRQRPVWHVTSESIMWL